jgi:hypothetical protein
MYVDYILELCQFKYPHCNVVLRNATKMDAKDNSSKILIKTRPINNTERQGWFHNQTDDFPSKMALTGSFKFDKITTVVT